VERNWKVVVLSFPSSIAAPGASLPTGVARVSLGDMSEEHLQAQLAEIAQKFGPVGAFIHLNPPFTSPTDGMMYSETEKQIIKHIFLLGKHLKDSLTTAAKNGSAVFMTVVQLDGKFGFGSDFEYSPISGGLFGLVKTLNLEWEPVFCRAVDISPEIPFEEVKDLVIAEIFDPNRRIIEVGYSREGRNTLVIEPSDSMKVLS
jgi:hypothetical protein